MTTTGIDWARPQTEHGETGWAGIVGKIRLFSITWSGGADPWVLSCRLPGYDTQRWRKATEDEAKALAALVLTRWLTAIGAHLDKTETGSH